VARIGRGTAEGAPWREVNENDFIVLISERLPCYLIVKRRSRKRERERKRDGTERGVKGREEVNSGRVPLGVAEEG